MPADVPQSSPDASHGAARNGTAEPPTDGAPTLDTAARDSRLPAAPTSSAHENERAAPDFDAALRVAWVTAALALVSYVLRVAPTAYLLDSSEFVATTAALGISHPPGHPAYHLLGVGWLAVPVGTAAFRLHLFSACCAAATAGLLPWTAWRVGWASTRASMYAAGGLGLALALTAGFTLQAIRAEVYALNALLTCGAWAAVLPAARGSGVRGTLVAAALLGVGLLNHHLLVIMAFPATALAVLTMPGSGAGASAWGDRWRRVGAGTAMGAFVLVGYAYLPLRAAARPATSWGWPVSAGEIYWHVSAQAFQKTATLAAERGVGAEALAALGGVLVDELTWVGVAAAAIGLVLAWRRGWRVPVVLVVGGALNLAPQLSYDFDPLNPDARGYFMPAFWVLLLLAVPVLDVLARYSRGPAVALAVGLVALGTAANAALSPLSTNLAARWDSERLRDAAERGLPPDAAWVSAYYETGFNTWYGRAVEDRRPDVTHLHLASLTHPFYRPMIAGTPVEGLVTPAGAAGPLLHTDGVLAWAARAAVRVEAEQVIDAALGRSLRPGLLYFDVDASVSPEGELPAAVTAEYAAATEQALARWGGATGLETQMARNWVWAHFNAARILCRAGRVEACRVAIGAALQVAPGESTLEAFARSIPATR